jgi:hypothetical protein
MMCGSALAFAFSMNKFRIILKVHVSVQIHAHTQKSLDILIRITLMHGTKEN